MKLRKDDRKARAAAVTGAGSIDGYVMQDGDTRQTSLKSKPRRGVACVSE